MAKQFFMLLLFFYSSFAKRFCLLEPRELRPSVCSGGARRSRAPVSGAVGCDGRSLFADDTGKPKPGREEKKRLDTVVRNSLLG